MTLKQKRLIFIVLFTLGSMMALSGAARGQSVSGLTIDPHRVPWTRLSFHAKNFWVEVSTDIQLRSLTASEADAVLLTSPKGTPIKPQTSKTAQLKISTTIDPRFRSAVNIYNSIWFDPTNAAALGRVRLKRGDDDFKKTYRFTKQGVFRHRVEPKNKQEISLTPEKWTDRNNSFYPYDLSQLGCSGVSERSLLIYVISSAVTSLQENSLSLCVFGKRQLHRVTLRKAGEYPIRINYVENKQQTSKRQQKILKALKITLTAEPMGSDLKEAENFSFLGFHKDISIDIDPATGLPLQANGMIPAVGKVSLKLSEAHFKQ